MKKICKPLLLPQVLSTDFNSTIIVSALALTEMILHPDGRWTFLFVFWFILWLTFLRRGETGRGNKSWIIPLNSLNIRRKIGRRSLMKTTNGICPESFWSYELVLTIKKLFPEKRPTLEMSPNFTSNIKQINQLLFPLKLENHTFSDKFKWNRS